jgi:hypothetical protein
MRVNDLCQYCQGSETTYRSQNSRKAFPKQGLMDRALDTDLTYWSDGGDRARVTEMEFEEEVSPVRPRQTRSRVCGRPAARPARPKGYPSDRLRAVTRNHRSSRRAVGQRAILTRLKSMNDPPVVRVRSRCRWIRAGNLRSRAPRGLQ